MDSSIFRGNLDLHLGGGTFGLNSSLITLKPLYNRSPSNDRFGHSYPSLDAELPKSRFMKIFTEANNLVLS